MCIIDCTSMTIFAMIIGGFFFLFGSQLDNQHRSSGDSCIISAPPAIRECIRSRTQWIQGDNNYNQVIKHVAMSAGDDATGGQT